MFGELGAAIIDTDVIAREVVAPGQPALQEIRAQFGPAVINEDGTLRRRALRNLIFAEPTARNNLEAILHPRIGEATRLQADAAPGPYQIIVVPLLVDSALLEFVTRVLVVDVDEQIQIDRLLARDTETAAQARRILAAQSSREKRLAIADDLIKNDGNLDDLRAQVIALDQRYRHLAGCDRCSN